MLTYLIRRLGWTVMVLLGVAVLTFLLIHLIPGSPWESNRGRAAMSNMFVSDAALRTLNRRFGLDLPLPQQFVRAIVGYNDPKDGFVCGYVCGNLGPSMFQRGRTVEEILFEVPENGGMLDSRFGYTLRLTGLSLLMTVLIGLPAGIYSAVRRNSSFDSWATLLSAVGMSTPNFVLGLLMIIVLSSGLHLIKVLPDWNRPLDWVMPALILAIAPAGMLTRITRSAMLDALQGDYVRTARGKGLHESDILRVHVLKNAAIPIITHLGPMLFELIAASFVIEIMFGFPGFGREYYEAITRMDYPMIMALTLLYGLFMALANLLADMLYAVFDPRVRVH